MSEDMKSKKKCQPSMLDPFKDEIKKLYELGLNPNAISILINEKLHHKLRVNTYRHFIQTKIKSN